MSRYFDLSSGCVLYGDTMLPQDAFYTADTAEIKLISLAFEVARGVAELKLTETELALYSACVLLSSGLLFNFYENDFSFLFVYNSLHYTRSKSVGNIGGSGSFQSP